jgi:hypothetical protein
MNLDELNKQLFSLQNEFQYQSNNANNANKKNPIPNINKAPPIMVISEFVVIAYIVNAITIPY